jgi:hypothetical protein
VYSAAPAPTNQAYPAATQTPQIQAPYQPTTPAYNPPPPTNQAYATAPPLPTQTPYIPPSTQAYQPPATSTPPYQAPSAPTVQPQQQQYNSPPNVNNNYPSTSAPVPTTYGVVAQTYAQTQSTPIIDNSYRSGPITVPAPTITDNSRPRVSYGDFLTYLQKATKQQ